MADTPILTQAQDALTRLLGDTSATPFNVGGDTRGATTDATEVSSDLQGKSHQAYAQRLIDEEAAKKAAAEQEAALNAKLGITSSTSGPKLTTADFKGLKYTDLVKGYQDAVGRYQGAMSNWQKTKDNNSRTQLGQYSKQMGDIGTLMGLTSIHGGSRANDETLGQLDYNTYAPLIKQYTTLSRA